jgi:hypothetical protein
MSDESADSPTSTPAPETPPSIPDAVPAQYVTISKAVNEDSARTPDGTLPSFPQTKDD